MDARVLGAVLRERLKLPAISPRREKQGELVAGDRRIALRV